MNAAPLTFGRGGQNDVPLDGDEFVSARHARFQARRDGAWVEDVGSTNGTFVNGERLRGPRLLKPRRHDHGRRDRAPLPAMTIRDAAGATDTGHKRRRNEDAYVLEPPLFAVADGMGGHQAGEVASRLAAAALREDVEPAGGPERVEALIREANRRIWQASTEDVTASGMGTTVTVALVEGRPGHDRPRRRLARLPRPRPADRAAHRRPLARRRAGAQRQALGRGGPRAPAALRDHARARHRARRRDRHVHRGGPARRPLPALLRRTLLDGGGRRDPRGARGQARQPGSGRARARPRRQPKRRRGQHHGRLLRAGRRRGDRSPSAGAPTRTRSTAPSRSRSRLRPRRREPLARPPG